jgi:hypothetical protein
VACEKGEANALGPSTHRVDWDRVIGLVHVNEGHKELLVVAVPHMKVNNVVKDA